MKFYKSISEFFRSYMGHVFGMLGQPTISWFARLIVNPQKSKLSVKLFPPKGVIFECFQSPKQILSFRCSQEPYKWKIWLLLWVFYSFFLDPEGSKLIRSEFGHFKEELSSIDIEILCQLRKNPQNTAIDSFWNSTEWWSQYSSL